MKVKHGSRLGSLQLAADQSCLVSRSGSALVPELAARLGLERELSQALAHLFRRRPQHDPGRLLVWDIRTTSSSTGTRCHIGRAPESPRGARRTFPRRPTRA